MRSLSKDVRRVVSVSTLVQVPNAASANGTFSDGTPWQMVRTSTGTFEMTFDSRLIPLSGAIGLDQNARISPSFGAMSPGKMFVHFVLFDGTDVNATFDLTINWLDTR